LKFLTHISKSRFKGRSSN